MTRPIYVNRDEAEALVDVCEATRDGRLWDLAAQLRGQWGMGPQPAEMPKPEGDAVLVPKAKLREWHNTMSIYTTSDSDGESYNNDDAIQAAAQMGSYLEPQGGRT